MSRIKIVSNVLNDELYSYSKSFYESMKYDKIAISGKDGKYFAFNLINHVITNPEQYDFDWMVYVDEVSVMHQWHSSVWYSKPNFSELWKTNLSLYNNITLNEVKIKAN